MMRRLFTILTAILMVLSCMKPVVHADSDPVLRFSEGRINEVTAGSGYTITGTSLEITASGVYRISGSCNEGSISVAKGV